MCFGEAVGRVGEDSVVVVRVHQLVDHVGGRFELGVFVVALFERGKSDEFEDLPTGTASLQWSVS